MFINNDVKSSHLTSNSEIKDPINGDERISKISKINLSKSDESVVQLQQLYRTRIKAPGEWPGINENLLDCEGFAHYLMTGTVGEFEEIKNPAIRKVDYKNAVHQPYTCYEIWQPNPLWCREKSGFWGPVHFFTHLENGKYISLNGCGDYRLFKSFEEMLRKDAFVWTFITEDAEPTKDIDKAMIGESLVETIHE